MITGRRMPHPIPYQGSKRALASRILAFFPRERIRLFEPFAGSAAVSLAAAANRRVNSVILNDANGPLIELWRRIINQPEELAAVYARLWNEQIGDERAFYDQVRHDFNKSHNPDLLLYLLARCVKASVRYNTNGAFNQSPDNRRRGAKPETMATHIRGASLLLGGLSVLRSGDFRDALFDVGEDDLVYMDPPYQGVCGQRDSRYCTGLMFEEFVESLSDLADRRVSFIVSYDGKTGEKQYGNALPEHLGLTHISLEAGTSSQGTLLGRTVRTVESLYLSQALSERIGISKSEILVHLRRGQLSFFEGIDA